MLIMLDLGFASRIEVWIALGTGIAVLILILYAMEAKHAVKEMEKWLDDIKFNEWLEKKNNKKKED
ncbi:MAG: hypothetical protein J7J93_01865 [Candidatus Aenigmarchaeota archaeon]|nr:hypothetical protein [Candidatus Aenigmarchaeota archaeon]